MRSYHLSYLITAWAADTAEEHELLGAVIGAHAESDAIEKDYLRGSLRGLDSAMPMRLGWSPTAGSLDMWGALGVPMRTALELTVTAPALPSRLKLAAPPVEAVEVEVHDNVDRALVPQPPRRRWERTTVTEH
jgi:Pvc16 N-terminal domain